MAGVNGYRRIPVDLASCENAGAILTRARLIVALDTNACCVVSRLKIWLVICSQANGVCTQPVGIFDRHGTSTTLVNERSTARMPTFEIDSSSAGEQYMHFLKVNYINFSIFTGLVWQCGI
jgi:hypothetical protein